MRAALSATLSVLAAAVSAAAAVRVARQPRPADLSRLGIDAPLRLP